METIASAIEGDLNRFGNPEDLFAWVRRAELELKKHQARRERFVKRAFRLARLPRAR